MNGSEQDTDRREFRRFHTHGTGEFSLSDLSRVGDHVVIEPHVLIFHPENIEIGTNVYVGHYTILKGYHENKMIMGDNVWIGQGCFFHSAGGIRIGSNVGIGPGVSVLTSFHRTDQTDRSILASDLTFAEVVIEDDCDIGTGAILLPGVRIGKGSQVGAGSVVTRNVQDYAIVAGTPARFLRSRKPPE
ncbi:MAG: acyltransferase [Armatimonadetes bacterium]|nr:acyltransferase [Armatimonadota bacterium]